MNVSLKFIFSGNFLIRNWTIPYKHGLVRRKLNFLFWKSKVLFMSLKVHEFNLYCVLIYGLFDESLINVFYFVLKVSNRTKR